MKERFVMIVLWTVFWVVLFIVVGSDFTRDRVYTGTDIEFTINRNEPFHQLGDKTIEIDANEVTFEAVSSGFFIFRRESGETIVGTPAIAPLGWNDKYFTARQEGVSSGKWSNPNGGLISVKITSQTPASIRLVENNKILIWIVVGMLIFFLWFFMLIFMI